MSGTQTIEGISSGLDITSMVDAIMSYERYPITVYEQDKEFKTQQVAAYQAVLAKFISLQSQVALMKKESSYNQAAINISDDTVLSASAADRVTPGTYNINVISLARNHQLASRGVEDATTDILGTGTIQIGVGEAGLTTINIDSENNSLIAVKDAINEANVGVTASIINDGTASNAYRLLLVADDTGAANTINITTNLSGGVDLDFETSSFDNPEMIRTSSSTTSTVSLGSTASYGGAQNKIYTFTVQGNGTQSVGSDIITLEWSDGTNTGTVLVTQADTEIELTGDGSDGLKIAFSYGELTAGDTFQVETFSPLLQNASDARISVGGDGSDGGSPIVISSDSNHFEDVIPGIALDVNKTTEPGESITISTDIDTAAIKTMVTDLVDKYNDVMEFIDEQFTYDSETSESGVLFAEYSLQVMQSSLRSAATSIIDGLQGEISSLSAIGIRTGADGQLDIVNSATLTDAIENDYDNFVDLFIDSGDSSTQYVEFLSATENTLAGQDYEVVITRAASRGYYQGAAINDPASSPITLDSSNNVVKFKVNGLVSEELILTEGTYRSGNAIAREIQTKIDNDERLQNSDITVEWVQLPDSGYLKITGGTYGANSQVRIETGIANNAYNILGLSGGVVHAGQDVAGTINGESATGKGRILTGDEDNATTDGLKLEIKYSENQILYGSASATISYSQGLGAKLYNTLENTTKSIDGSIARRTSALNNQIGEINEQIDDFEEWLAIRRESLYEQFLNMESLMSQYQSEGTYLEQQLAGINDNWSQIKGN